MEHQPGDHRHDADSGQTVPVADPSFDRLRYAHGVCEQHIRAKVRLDNQITAICLREIMAGERRAPTEADRKKAQAVKKKYRAAPPEHLIALFEALDPVRRGKERWDKVIENEVRERWPHMAAWADSIRGLGVVSVGRLIAECAHLLASPSDQAPVANSGPIRNVDRRRQEARVYKRLGVGLVEWAGERIRQRKASDADLATLMGYQPRRRAILFVIGDCLMKQNDGRYRAIYETRKAFELARGIGKMHTEYRAKRYMTKKLVRHFLAEWNHGAAAGNGMPGVATDAPPLREVQKAASSTKPKAASRPRPPKSARPAAIAGASRQRSLSTSRGRAAITGAAPRAATASAAIAPVQAQPEAGLLP